MEGWKGRGRETGGDRRGQTQFGPIDDILDMPVVYTLQPRSKSVRSRTVYICSTIKFRHQLNDTVLGMEDCCALSRESVFLRMDQALRENVVKNPVKT